MIHQISPTGAIHPDDGPTGAGQIRGGIGRNFADGDSPPPPPRLIDPIILRFQVAASNDQSAINDIRAFCYTIQLCYFLAIGMVNFMNGTHNPAFCSLGQKFQAMSPSAPHHRPISRIRFPRPVLRLPSSADPLAQLPTSCRVSFLLSSLFHSLIFCSSTFFDLSCFPLDWPSCSPSSATFSTAISNGPTVTMDRH